MKLISCSICHHLVKPRLTTIVEHKRVCHVCRAKKKPAKKEPTDKRSCIFE